MAAEQCGVLNIAEVAEPKNFDSLTRGWRAERLLVFCDEDAEVKDPVAALAGARALAGTASPALAVLIGPEGGFDAGEVELAERHGFEIVSLGDHILRTESAVLAALAIVQYEWGNLG